jgi:hypothetical protein
MVRHGYDLNTFSNCGNEHSTDHNAPVRKSSTRWNVFLRSSRWGNEVLEKRAWFKRLSKVEKGIKTNKRTCQISISDPSDIIMGVVGDVTKNNVRFIFWENFVMRWDLGWKEAPHFYSSRDSHRWSRWNQCCLSTPLIRERFSPCNSGMPHPNPKDIQFRTSSDSQWIEHYHIWYNVLHFPSSISILSE